MNKIKIVIDGVDLSADQVEIYSSAGGYGTVRTVVNADEIRHELYQPGGNGNTPDICDGAPWCDVAAGMMDQEMRAYVNDVPPPLPVEESKPFIIDESHPAISHETIRGLMAEFVRDKGFEALHQNEWPSWSAGFGRSDIATPVYDIGDLGKFSNERYVGTPKTTAKLEVPGE